MVKDGRVGSGKRTQKGKRATAKIAWKENDRASIRRKRGWSDVFEKLTYSSGPGDNIYVFG